MESFATGLAAPGTAISVVIWGIALATIAGVLLRPKNWPEAVWACSGALLLVASGILPVTQAGMAIARGTDVYLFLTGMLLLSELARQEGVFDWLASLATAAAKGSGARLFALIYAVGIAVTVFLSNDATAVVLTPAVYAAVQKARAKPMPYLLICAFIANAASFVLPISNPANLVVYGKHLPPLIPWLRTFLLPSLCSVGATYVVLRWVLRKHLEGKIEKGGDPAPLSSQGRFAAWGIVATGATLMCASAFGLDLGLPTCISAAVAVLAATHGQPPAIGKLVRQVSWSVLPLVAGLFVVVEGLNRTGALQDLGNVLQRCAGMPRASGALLVSFGMAGLSNVMNNLPSGLLAGGALRMQHLPPPIWNAVLLGVDLGPNLSVTGSLATILWLIALRREGEHISGGTFLKVGMAVMPPALLLATLAMVWK
jgi:arsenical pump membrane protein